MAEKKSSKRTKESRSSAPLAATAGAAVGADEYSQEQLAAIGRRVVSEYAEARLRSRQRAEAEAEIERRGREGKHISAVHLDLISRALSSINMGAVSAHHLSMDATDNPERAEKYHVAIENIALVIARKCDFIASILDDHPSYGNFTEEFDVKEALAKMEPAEEAHHA